MARTNPRRSATLDLVPLGLVFGLVLIGTLLPAHAWADSRATASPSAAAAEQPQRANALAGNPSPYLAMHGTDPVDWQPWGPEILAQAKALNRPIFISSGYFACHWCHVMQRESYRDPGIAELLNRHFIPVKVDRELHPALDAYLIDFTQRTVGQAGWPLNVVITPDGYPLTGFTYEPTERLSALLKRLIHLWETRGAELGALAREEAQRLAAPTPAAAAPDSALPGPDAVAGSLVTQALNWADQLGGGFGHQSRFPMAPSLAALLEAQARGSDPQLGPFLRLTFDHMTQRALRDHLGGGFYRYTVDPDWHTPHFEKMLYDQALLVPLLLRASEVLDEPHYRVAARETLDFLLAQMRRPDGAFIASLSAVDGAGEEGGYYLWRREDLARLLSPEALRLVLPAWGLDGVPEHAAGALPVPARNMAKIIADLGLDQTAATALLDQGRKALLAERAGRSLPMDTKALAAWNGLTLSALVAGARAFPDGPYRGAAQSLRGYLVDQLWDGTELHRARSDQGWIGEATLEDYAFVALGLRDWAELAGSDPDLALSRRMVRLAWERFHSDTGWRLAAAPLLPEVPAELALSDGPLPSPAAVVLDLSLRDADPALASQARAVQAAAAPQILAHPFQFVGEAWLLVRYPEGDLSGGEVSPGE